MRTWRPSKAVTLQKSQANGQPRENWMLMQAGYNEILQHIYAPKHYYQRIRTFLREFKPPKTRVPLRGSHLLAFVRSFYRLGIVGQERFYYWYLLLWTQFRRPRLFTEAITLAIYGYHFRKIFKRHIT